MQGIIIENISNLYKVSPNKIETKEEGKLAKKNRDQWQTNPERMGTIWEFMKQQQEED